MGLAQVYAAMVANGMWLNLERMPVIGLHKSYSSDNLITDSAAGATAFSIGKKTYNGAIGVDSTGKPNETILEEAHRKGMATGLVVTCAVTHATPASFVAHQKSRAMNEAIALDFLQATSDVVIGGGKQYFEKREDKRNLIVELKGLGYTYVSNKDSLNYNPNSEKFLALLANDELPKMSEGRSDYLPVATQAALERLSKNKKGFFLMVEGSQIDWGGHNNEADYIIRETIDFDATIKTVLDFAEKDEETLVIVTADHETGGLAINGGSKEKKLVEAAFTTKKHTGILIPVYSFGPGSTVFSGIYENTAIYHKMKWLLNW
jgi:alkaline phosphatase